MFPFHEIHSNLSSNFTRLLRLLTARLIGRQFRCRLISQKRLMSHSWHRSLATNDIGVQQDAFIQQTWTSLFYYGEKSVTDLLENSIDSEKISNGFSNSNFTKHFSKMCLSLESIVSVSLTISGNQFYVLISNSKLDITFQLYFPLNSKFIH